MILYQFKKFLNRPRIPLAVFSHGIKESHDITLLAVHSVKRRIMLVNVAIPHISFRLLSVKGERGSLHKGRVLLFHSVNLNRDGNTPHAVVEHIDHINIRRHIMIQRKSSKQPGYRFRRSLTAQLPSIPVGIGKGKMLDIFSQNVAFQICQSDFRHTVTRHHQYFKRAAGRVLGKHVNPVGLPSKCVDGLLEHGAIAVHAHAENCFHAAVPAVNLPLILNGLAAEPDAARGFHIFPHGNFRLNGLSLLIKADGCRDQNRKTDYRKGNDPSAQQLNPFCDFPLPPHDLPSSS